jgi:hypothetical protein
MNEPSKEVTRKAFPVLVFMLWFLCRFGLLAQALMMMVTVGFLFRDYTI